MNEILDVKYGIREIQSIGPMGDSSSTEDGPPLLIQTKNGDRYVFRRETTQAGTNTNFSEPGASARGIVKTLAGESSLEVGGVPMVLELIGSSHDQINPPAETIGDSESVARQVEGVLGPMGKLGVDFSVYMDIAARKTVEVYGRGSDHSLWEPGSPWVFQGKGIHVLIVDALSVNTPDKVAALAEAVRGKAVRIITNAMGLSVPGVDAGHVLWRPFTPVLSAEGKPLGLVEVSLAGLEKEIKEMGGDLRYYQTAVIQLNADGLKDPAIAEAARKGWILGADFRVLFPVSSIDWRGVLKTLAAIARNA